MSDIGSQMSEGGGYHKLQVYRAGHELAVRIHKMTLSLPGFERFEEGAQVRRSSKRVSSSIVEGYAQRKYKALFLSYLYRALGSADETQEHLRYLIETRSLKDEKEGRQLLRATEDLSRGLVLFIKGIEREHQPRPLLKPLRLEEPSLLDPEADLSPSTSDIRPLTSRNKSRKAKG